MVLCTAGQQQSLDQQFTPPTGPPKPIRARQQFPQQHQQGFAAPPPQPAGPSFGQQRPSQQPESPPFSFHQPRPPSQPPPAPRLGPAPSNPGSHFFQQPMSPYQPGQSGSNSFGRPPQQQPNLGPQGMGQPGQPHTPAPGHNHAQPGQQSWSTMQVIVQAGLQSPLGSPSPHGPASQPWQQQPPHAPMPPIHGQLQGHAHQAATPLQHGHIGPAAPQHQQHMGDHGPSGQGPQGPGGWGQQPQQQQRHPQHVQASNGGPPPPPAGKYHLCWAHHVEPVSCC